MPNDSLTGVVVGGLLTMGGVAITGVVTVVVHLINRAEDKEETPIGQIRGACQIRLRV